jgi:hypothetical protein
VDRNISGWSEGEVVQAKYRQAECTFLAGRLVSITYKADSKRRPKTLVGALTAFGFPQEAANLGRGVPYRAMYTPNPEYRNPVRCCGLVFHLVSIPANFDEIWIVYANINLHFAEWPIEMQLAWKLAGGPRLTTNPREWEFKALPRRSRTDR